MRRPGTAPDTTFCSTHGRAEPIVDSTVTRDHEAKLGVLCQVVTICGHRNSVVRSREKAEA